MHHRRVPALATAAVALAACNLPRPDPPADPDAPVGNRPDAAPDIASVACHNMNDPAVLCVDFEESSLVPSVPDQSPAGNTVATSNVQSVARGGEQAARLVSTSRMTIAESPSLEFASAFTLEMFANPEQLPATGQVVSLFDSNGEYGLQLVSTGVRCVIGAIPAVSATPIATKVWTHLACVFDGVQLFLYVDGSKTASATTAPPIDTGSIGSAIGSKVASGGALSDTFVGSVDNVGIYAMALPSVRICNLAGGVACPN